MSRRIKLTVVMTHPIQYYSPWFRYIAREADVLQLKVIYVTEPTPAQQGVGFDEPFEWDVALRDGYENEVLRSPRSNDQLSSDGFFGLDCPEIGSVLERLKPDVVLVSGWYCLALMRAIVACRSRGFPLLYRGDTYLQGRTSSRHVFWRLRTRVLLNQFQGYLSVGSRVLEYLTSLGVRANRIFYSPHAVDNDFFANSAAQFQRPGDRSEARRVLGFDEEDFIVLFVGKLEWQKRPDDLLQAIHRSSRRLALLVAGTGPLEGKCRMLAEDLNVRVNWLGFVNQSKLGKIYAVSDCLVLPSDWETWGLVVNEALATGLPCIVSDRVGCAPDLIDPGRTGEVFPATNVDALSVHLERLRSEKVGGHSREKWCRQKIELHDFRAATEGVVSACASVI